MGVAGGGGDESRGSGGEDGHVGTVLGLVLAGRNSSRGSHLGADLLGSEARRGGDA